MNDAADTTQPQARQGQSLATVLAQTFHASTDAAFAERFVGLTAALVNTQQVFVYVAGADKADLTLIAGTGAPREAAAIVDIARKYREGDAREPTRFGDYLALQIALPSGTGGTVVLAMPQGAGVVQALTHERVSLLQALASAQFRNTELAQVRATLAAGFGLADPTDDRLQAFADKVAVLTDAQYAAIGTYDGQSVRRITVSGQGDAAKRAALPDRLRDDMVETAQQKLSTPARQFLGRMDQDHGLVLLLEGPRRNTDLVPLVGSAVRAASPAKRPQRGVARRIRRWAVAALVCAGLAAIPLPDGVTVNATVAATNFRVVTAPYSAAVVEITVADGQLATAEETPLARMDASEIVNELIAAQADYAAALLERETARAGRDAAALRTAELEAERIDARIALLEARQTSAELIAPISGLVIGPDLQSRQGAIVTQGEVLMQIADPAQVRLDVEVQQDALARVTAGMEGTFRPDFDPTLVFDATLTTVSPAALDTDRQPIFAARADLSGNPDQLRHGMSGVLSLDRQWRPLGLILWDAIRDWVLLRLWP